MASRAALIKNWLGDVSSYPLFILLGSSVALVGYSGYRHLFQNPEVTVKRTERKAGVDTVEHYRRGHNFHDHMLRKLRFDQPVMGPEQKRMEALSIEKASGVHAKPKIVTASATKVQPIPTPSASVQMVQTEAGTVGSKKAPKNKVAGDESHASQSKKEKKVEKAVDAPSKEEKGAEKKMKKKVVKEDHHDE